MRTFEWEATSYIYCNEDYSDDPKGEFKAEKDLTPDELKEIVKREILNNFVNISIRTRGRRLLFKVQEGDLELVYDSTNKLRH